MPETRGGEAGAANVFYALGEEAGMGFSPFGIDDEMDPKGALAQSYHAIEIVAPMVLEHQAAGDLHGFVLDRSHSSVDFTVAGYTVHVTLDEIFGTHAQNGFGLIFPPGRMSSWGSAKGSAFRLGRASDRTPGSLPSMRAPLRMESGPRAAA